MSKEETYSFLKEQGIDFEVVEHKAVYNMEDLDTITLPHPEAEAPRRRRPFCNTPLC